MVKEIERRRFLPNLDVIADYLACSKRTVQRLMKDEGLPAVSMGRNRVTCTPDRLDAWMAKRNREAA